MLSLPKHPTHDTVFNNKYPTLTFQTFLKKTFIFCVTTLVDQATEYCAGSGAERSHRFIVEIRDRYRDHIPVYTDGSRGATVFPSNTVISMRLPDLTSVFIAEVWAIIKAN